MNTYLLVNEMVYMLLMVVACYFFRLRWTPRGTLGFVQFIPLIAAGISAGAKAIKAHQQRKEARKLQESKFVPPELMMNRDLAQLQAYSQRAPGSAQAESNIRRSQANSLAAGLKNSGGSAVKAAANAVASQGVANDALARVDAAGEQFTQNALGRLANANIGIASQKRQNRDEYNRAKSQLLAASDQNYFNSFNDLMNGALATATLGTPGNTTTTTSSEVANPFRARGTYDYLKRPNVGAYA